MNSQKQTFSPDDFNGHGQLVVRCDYDGANHQFGASVAYKIGYDPQQHNHCLIALSDGLILTYSSLDQICTKLNGDERGYRFLLDSEIVNLIREIGNRWTV